MSHVGSLHECTVSLSIVLPSAHLICFSKSKHCKKKHYSVSVTKTLIYPPVMTHTLAIRRHTATFTHASAWQDLKLVTYESVHLRYPRRMHGSSCHVTALWYLRKEKNNSRIRMPKGKNVYFHDAIVQQNLRVRQRVLQSKPNQTYMILMVRETTQREPM